MVPGNLPSQLEIFVYWAIQTHDARGRTDSDLKMHRQLRAQLYRSLIIDSCDSTARCILSIPSRTGPRITPSMSRQAGPRALYSVDDRAHR